MIQYYATLVVGLLAISLAWSTKVYVGPNPLVTNLITYYVLHNLDKFKCILICV